MSRAILCLSDDRAAEHSLRLALANTSPDWSVEFVASRDEFMSHPKPTLILLDLMLARESAVDVLRWLRTDPRYRDVPVFVLGSETIQHLVNEAYALGADSCLVREAFDEGFEPLAQGLATYASLLSPRVCAPC